MSSQALDHASQYLNNLLLARGLLQDGKAIDFTAQGLNGSADATSSRIINLVHDLVLRRDRDAEQKERFATGIRNLKAEEAQRVLDLQRLQDKNVQLKNEAAAAEAQSRLLKSSTKKAEMQWRDLKEQMLKLKSMLDQVRAKCISDVRKRDMEITKLKSHLAGMPRGKRNTSGLKIEVMNPDVRPQGGEMRGGYEVNNSNWSLAAETNDFLAAIVNETSTENVALRKMINDTMVYLKSMSGMDNLESTGLENDGIGIPGQYRKHLSTKVRMDSEGLIPVQDLAGQMTVILEHCRTILKDPSFVPIEEVQIRDEEITKLRVGWEKMADRWKEAVTMMSQWRQIMTNSEEQVKIDQWPTLRFSRSVAMRPDGQHILTQIEEEEFSSMLCDQNKHGSDNTSRESLIFDSEENGIPEGYDGSESELDASSRLSTRNIVTSPARRGIKLPGATSPLGTKCTNIQKSSPIRGPELSQSADSGIGSFDEDEDSENPFKLDKHQPRPADLTVTEKLAVVEAEATEATQELRIRQATTQKRKMSSRAPTSRKSSRRKSALSAEELAELMAG